MRAHVAASSSDTTNGDWWWQVWRSGAVSVLVISARADWCEEAVAALEDDGFAVRVDVVGKAVTEPGSPFDLAVVDLAPERASPATVVAALRANSTLPILAVAPVVAPESAVLEAYAAGADQCMTRNGRPNELVARVRALLRRTPPRPHHVADLREIRVGSLVLDLGDGTVRLDGIPVELTHREVELLRALVRRPGTVVPREQLTSGGPETFSDQSLDAAIRRLRAKLEAIEGHRRILNVRGVGFRYVTGDQAVPDACGAPLHTPPAPIVDAIVTSGPEILTSIRR